MEQNENLAKRLIKIRKDHGYTRQKLSDELNIPYYTIRNYELGIRDPSLSYITTLAKKFDLTTDFIFGVTEVPLPAPVEHSPEQLGSYLVRALTERGLLTNTRDLTGRDADFLSHWLGLLDAWVQEKNT